MAKLQIKTNLNCVVLCGEFCEWDIDNSVKVERVKGAKTIVKSDMPSGEYKVFSCKSYTSTEVYPTDGRAMANRYFSGDADETINVYFEEARDE